MQNGDLPNRVVEAMNVRGKLTKDVSLRRLFAAIFIFGALASGARGILLWRNFAYLSKHGVEVDAQISDLARNQRSGKAVTITFVTTGNQQVVERFNVTNQFYYNRLKNTDLVTSQFKVRYSRHNPSNFLLVDGTDTQVDAFFVFSIVFCLIAAFTLLPLPTVQDEASKSMDRSGSTPPG